MIGIVKFLLNKFYNIGSYICICIFGVVNFFYYYFFFVDCLFNRFYDVYVLYYL